MYRYSVHVHAPVMCRMDGKKTNRNKNIFGGSYKVIKNKAYEWNHECSKIVPLFKEQPRYCSQIVAKIFSWDLRCKAYEWIHESSIQCHCFQERPRSRSTYMYM